MVETYELPELALDHRQRHSLPGELHRVSMTELVRGKPAPYTGRRRMAS